MNPLRALKPWFSSRVSRWLERSLPAVSEVQLHRKNIFILPSGAGFLFLIVTGLIVVTAINYALSLAFALAFLMVSLFTLCIFHSFRNLQHLCVRGAGAVPVFAGEDAAFVFVLQTSATQAHEMLELRFPNGAWSHADVLAGRQARVRVFLPSVRRGVLRAPRLTLQSRFPLGLWCAWSKVDLDMSVLVYPKPIAGPLPSAVGMAMAGTSQGRQVGVEDFYGLRHYNAGDSPKQIAWKSLARGQGLQVKQFVDATDEHVLLDWEQFGALHSEERLSRLCYWVLRLTERDVDFGLRLPGLAIARGRGDAHCQAMLRALALWPSGAQ